MARNFQKMSVILFGFVMALILPVLAKNEPLSPTEILSLLNSKIEGYLRDPELVERAKINDYYKDGLELLKKYSQLGTPKLIFVQGKPIKYLVPIVVDSDTMAGFIHVEPFDGDIIGWPTWDSKGRPLNQISKNEWEGKTNSSWTENISEMIPSSLLESPGFRVDPYMETGWNIIDHGLDEMPFKNQEDRKEWIKEINSQHQPRPAWTSFGDRWRQPALKCLSFAAAACADWWSMEYQRPMGSYTNVVNGGKEYGHNPRAIETVFYVRHRLNPKKYFTVPIYPDPVTHEPIPYSLPGYVDALIHPMRGILPDTALPSAFVYSFPPDPFCMEGEGITLFRFNRGKSGVLKQALFRHGIVYAQQVSGIPVVGALSGIHAVAVVGYKETASGTQFIYRESFGNFSSKYQEDMTGGPKYRACGIEGFNQAYAFPHQLKAEISGRTERQIRLKVYNQGNAPIDVDPTKVLAELQDNSIPLLVKPGKIKGELVLESSSELPTKGIIKVVLPRKYYYKANGKPSEVKLIIHEKKPVLDPYDLALKRVVDDALDRLEAFVTSLEVRKSSYAFYSVFARWRISRQLGRVLRHRLQFDQVWEAFEKSPTPQERKKLISMMRGAFVDYKKQLKEYENELTKRIKSEKNIILKERLEVELLEVKGFIISLEKLQVRLEAIISVLPGNYLESSASIANQNASDSLTAAMLLIDNQTDTEGTGKNISENEEEKFRDSSDLASPRLGKAYTDYQNAYLSYQKAIDGGKEDDIRKAIIIYREAFDRYRSIQAGP